MTEEVIPAVSVTFSTGVLQLICAVIPVPTPSSKVEAVVICSTNNVSGAGTFAPFGGKIT